MDNFDIVFYKRAYPKLARLSNMAIYKHWEKVGKNKLLGSRTQFSTQYPDFDVSAYRRYNEGLRTVGIKTDEALMCHFWHYGHNEKRIFKELKDGADLDDIINCHGVDHCYFSSDMTNEKRRLLLRYNLSERIKPGLPLIVFSMTDADYLKVKDHDNTLYIILTKDLSISSITKIKSIRSKIVFVTKTCRAMKKLDKFGVEYKLIDVDMVDSQLFRPVEETGDCIYVCDSKKSMNGDMVRRAVLSIFPSDKIIYSSKLNLPRKKMPQQYGRCFISLRLTGASDVNPRSVSELEAMKIPVIHNNSYCGLKWNDVGDVVSHINNHLPQTYPRRNHINVSLNVLALAKYNNILIINECNCREDIDVWRDLKTVLTQTNNSSVTTLFYSRKRDVVSDDIVTVGKLRSEVRSLGKDFDLVIVGNPLPVEIKQIIPCEMFYIMKDDDCTVPLSRPATKYVKMSDRVFATGFNFIEHLKKINTRSSEFCLDNVSELIEHVSNDDNVDFSILSTDVDDTTEDTPSQEEAEEDRSENPVEDIKEYVESREVKVENKVEVSVDIIDGTPDELDRLKYRDCRVVPIVSEDIIKTTDENEVMTHVICSKSVLILDTWNYNSDKDKVDSLQKTIEYYRRFNIRVNYLLYTDRTLFLNNSRSNIKYVDAYNSDDLEFMYLKVIHNNIDLLIINDERVNDYAFVDKIKMSSRRIMSTNKINSSLEAISKRRLKVFINFAAKDIAYGGGNVFVQNIIKHMDTIDNIEYTFTLDDDIDIYFLIDVRKDRHFKKFTFDQIYDNKVKNGKGKIVYRVNDCDVTRVRKSLEPVVLQCFDRIDHFIFNSEFIKQYYFDKYPQFNRKRFSIIYNTSDGDKFYPKKRGLNKRIRLVTHHWSDNINKGYDYYHKLYELSKTRDDIEMVFIGRKFNDNYPDHPKIVGPLKGMELANALRDCDMYVTGSIFDACPMHVLEGLAAGLPMLYIDHEGGGRGICNFTNKKVGEPFKNFDELLNGIEKIKNNYDMYTNNIKENIELYNSDDCYCRFVKTFTKEDLAVV